MRLERSPGGKNRRLEARAAHGPTRASSGPTSNTDPRSRPTRRGSGSSPVICRQHTRSVVVPTPLTSAPRLWRRSTMTPTSLIRGTFCSSQGSSVSTHAASSGRAAFLFPSTSIWPARRCPPSTTSAVGGVPLPLVRGLSVLSVKILPDNESRLEVVHQSDSGPWCGTARSRRGSLQASLNRHSR